MIIIVDIWELFYYMNLVLGVERVVKVLGLFLWKIFWDLVGGVDNEFDSKCDSEFVVLVEYSFYRWKW